MQIRTISDFSALTSTVVWLILYHTVFMSSVNENFAQWVAEDKKLSIEHCSLESESCSVSIVFLVSISFVLRSVGNEKLAGDESRFSLFPNDFSNLNGVCYSSYDVNISLVVWSDEAEVSKNFVYIHNCAMLVACVSLLILFYLISVTVLGEEYKSRSFPLV